MVTLGGTVAIELQVALPVWQLRMKCALGSIGVTANSGLSVVWGAGLFRLFALIKEIGEPAATKFGKCKDFSDEAIIVNF